ncbi:MAG TPA: hypothetical protein VI298_09610 [Geobacteraceae bacterium]
MRNIVKVSLLIMIVLPLMGFHDDPAEFYLLLADDMLTKGYPEAALSYLDKAIETDPACTKAYQSRGFFNLQRGRTDQALRDFSRVIELKPQDPAGYVTRGMALSQSGKKELAAADFRKGCDLGDPSACDFLKDSPSGSKPPANAD